MKMEYPHCGLSSGFNHRMHHLAVNIQYKIGARFFIF